MTKSLKPLLSINNSQQNLTGKYKHHRKKMLSFIKNQLQENILKWVSFRIIYSLNWIHQGLMYRPLSNHYKISYNVLTTLQYHLNILFISNYWPWCWCHTAELIISYTFFKAMDSVCFLSCLFHISLEALCQLKLWTSLKVMPSSFLHE